MYLQIHSILLVPVVNNLIKCARDKICRASWSYWDNKKFSKTKFTPRLSIVFSKLIIRNKVCGNKNYNNKIIALDLFKKKLFPYFKDYFGIYAIKYHITWTASSFPPLKKHHLYQNLWLNICEINTCISKFCL